MALYHPPTNEISFPYEVADGERLRTEPISAESGLTATVIRNRAPVLIRSEDEMRAAGAIDIGGAFSQSWLGVPILAGEELIGVLAMESPEPNAFDEGDVRLVSTLAASTGAALRNARLFDETSRLLAETEQRNAELAVINEIGEALAKQLDFQAIIDAVGERVMSIFQVDTGFLGLYHEASETLSMEYAIDVGERYRDLPPAALNLLTGPVIRSRRPVRLGTAAEAEELSPIIIGTDVAESWLGVPILAGDRVLGMIAIERRPKHAFSEADERLLATIAANVGVALENARLFDETKSLLAQTEQRASELAIINEIGAALSEQLEFEAIVDLVGERLDAMFKTESLFIGLFDEPTNMISFPYEVDSGKRVHGDPIEFGQGLSSLVLREKRPLRFATQAEQADQGGFMGTYVDANPDEHEQNESWLGVPIMSGRKAIGLVVLGELEPNHFTEADERLVATIAANLGVALENARLFDETRSLLAQTEQRNAELAVVNEISAALSKQLDFNAIIEAVGIKLGEVLGSQDMSIGIVDEKAGLIRTPYFTEDGVRDFDVEPLELGKGLSSRILATGQSIRIGSQEDAQGLGAVFVGDVDAEFKQSFLGVPIPSGDRFMGVLSVAKLERNAFSERDEQLVSTVAASMGVALENARLFGETKRLLTETEQRASELSIINEIGAALAEQLDFAAIVDLVGDRLVAMFRAQSFRIALYDRATNMIDSSYEIVDGRRVHSDAFAFGPGLTSQVLSSKKPLRLGTFTEQSELGGFLPTYVEDDDLSDDVDESWLGVPIMAGREAIGVVVISDPAPNKFSEADERLVATIAASMGVALENARLFDETKRLLSETNERAAELAIINSVQQGLAAKLDMQSMFELVGEKIAEIFDAPTMSILTFDTEREETTNRFGLERGVRDEATYTTPMSPFARHLIETGEPIVVNRDIHGWLDEHGLTVRVIGDDPKSMVFAPLVLNGQVAGAISLQNLDREDAFNESDFRLLTTLAASLSVALENARLFDETQRLLTETNERAAELAIINSVQEGLASQLDMRAMYDLVGDKIGEIFDAQVVVIISYDTASDIAHYHYMRERGERFGPVDELIDELSKQVIATRQPVRIADLGEWERDNGIHIPIVQGEPTKSLLLVPLLAGSEVVGAVSIQNVDHVDAFNEGDLRLLVTLGSSLSVALENARLFDETQRLLTETNERAAELAIINSVQEGLAAKLEMQSMYELVGDKIREIFDAQVVVVSLFDTEAQTATYPYVHERGARLEPTESPLGIGDRLLIDTGETVLINDLAAWEAETGLELPVIEGEAVKSIVAVPLLVDGSVYGALALQNIDRTNAFSDSDVRLLTTLTSSLSVALENARLFAETQRLLQETNERAAELAIINSVQEGLAAKLEMQSMYDLVGDKIQEIFDAQVVTIAIYDFDAELSLYPYSFERGKKAPGGNESTPITDNTRRMLALYQTGKPVVIDNYEEFEEQTGIKFTISGEPSKSMVFAPLSTGGKVFGRISLQNLDRYSAFSESDVRLITTLAGSLSVALENARLFDETQRLLTETNERAAELQIITSVQQGLAAKLDMQSMYELVGNKLVEIFGSQVVDIAVVDAADGKIHFPFAVERGERLDDYPIDLIGFRRHVLETREPLVIDRDVPAQAEAYGNPEHLEGETPKSAVFVPMVSGGVTGVLSLQSIDRADAFSASDVRLLTTLASSLTVALENARLFDETQRLLNETNERAAELAIINSVQEGLAAQLDMQSMYDLVGDKIQEIFDAQVVDIGLYDFESETVNFPYTIERGERFPDTPAPFTDATRDVINAKKPVLIPDVDADNALRGTEPMIVGERPQSIVMAPLISGDRVFGRISLQNLDRTHAFSEADVRLLTTLAASLSVALENARLVDETRQRAADLAIVNEVGQAAAAQLDLTRLMPLVGDKMRATFDADIVYLALYDREAGRISFPYYAEDGEHVPSADIQFGEGLTSRIISAREPVVMNQPWQFESLGIPVLGREAKSYLGVPIMVADQPIGVISVQSSTDYGRFGDSDVRLLSTIASSIGTAIQNARLYSESQRRGSEMAALADVGREISATLELSSVLQRIVERAQTLLGGTASAVFLPGADGGDTFRATAAAGDIAEQLKQMKVVRGTGIIGSLAAEGQPEVINDVNADPRGVQIEGTPANEEERLIVAPLLGRGGVNGMMAVWRTGPDTQPFTAADLAFLVGLSQQAAIAIDNATLFAELARRA